MLKWGKRRGNGMDGNLSSMELGGGRGCVATSRRECQQQPRQGLIPAGNCPRPAPHTPPFGMLPKNNPPTACPRLTLNPRHRSQMVFRAVIAEHHFNKAKNYCEQPTRLNYIGLIALKQQLPWLPEIQRNSWCSISSTALVNGGQHTL